MNNSNNSKELSDCTACISNTDINIEENEDFGSSDIGNVSHIVPTIHPNIGISNCRVIGHSREMADATISELGHERLLIGTLALAYTGYDVLTNKVEL